METKDLPKAPSFWKILGPSFVFLGLSLGSGELIMWPYLTANFGLGIIWGAFLGITFQFFMNMEIERYALVFGESVFVGFRKLWRGWPIWFMFSTFIAWGLPGFSAASSQILSRLFNFKNEALIAVFLLVLVGVILSAGKSLYKTLETFQKTIIFLGIPFIFILCFLLTKFADWQVFLAGIVGRGKGYLFLPEGISLMSFLGAFAYAGAGGNLNLAQSYYIKEKGYGMGKYAAKLKSLFSKENQKMRLEGVTFPVNKENLSEFKEWWKIINLEHLVIFWFLGFLTIALLSVLSYSLVYSRGGNLQGIGFFFNEALVIAQRLGKTFGIGFLVLGFFMLYSTQLTVLESTSRMISENFLLFSQKSDRKGVNLSGGFYLALWGQIFFGIVILLLGFKEPKSLLTLSAVINAFCMFIHLGLTYRLNRKFLPLQLRLGFFRKSVLLAAFIFFGVFSFLTLRQAFFP